jgi:farnesyl diphosphate synthase
MPGASPATTIDDLAAEARPRIDAALAAYTEFASAPDRLGRYCPGMLREAMRYSLLAPGKRLRPLLALLAARACGQDDRVAMPAACAVEMVHAYSLIHDDLPCMDDDDYRRGQPTVHKQFDEATAVLAGDALQALAFEIMASPETHRDALMRVKLIERMAIASGARGMVGGQMIDMNPVSESDEPLQVLTRMQKLKTGALITLAGEVGALLGGALENERQAIAGYTNDLGLAFQIVDDLLDVEGDPEILGKATAKDRQAGKVNFVSLLGIEGAQDRVRYLAAQAKQHLASFGTRASSLLHTVDFVLNRRH